MTHESIIQKNQPLKIKPRVLTFYGKAPWDGLVKNTQTLGATQARHLFQGLRLKWGTKGKNSVDHKWKEM